MATQLGNGLHDDDLGLQKNPEGEVEGNLPPQKSARATHYICILNKIDR